MSKDRREISPFFGPDVVNASQDKIVEIRGKDGTKAWVRSFLDLSVMIAEVAGIGVQVFYLWRGQSVDPNLAAALAGGAIYLMSLRKRKPH